LSVALSSVSRKSDGEKFAGAAPVSLVKRRSIFPVLVLARNVISRVNPSTGMEPQQMKNSRRHAKTVLRLPDLEHAKSAVLNSLASAESRRSYEFAIQNFVQWYCSEPRLALNRIVVTRYRMQLEQLHLAPSTINQRLAAVRRLAYEASDAGLLSPELAAGNRRVKGVKQLGVRVGNWLTAEQGRALIEAPTVETLRGKRDRAILGVLNAGWSVSMQDWRVKGCVSNRRGD
jgi:hypothetical protein